MAYEGCPFDVTPYDTSNLVKTPELISVNYTNQDFWSMKTRLINYIQEQFGESFNDFVESDLAIMLIENWAFIADTLSFKMDQIANEIFIDTVTEVDNAFRLAQLVGFKPQPPIGATSMWSAIINTVLETDLIINTPQIIDITTDEGLRNIELYAADSNNEPIFDEDIIITAGQFVNANIIGVEGITKAYNTIGTGEIGQSKTLPNSPVIGSSTRVFVNGIEWTEVDYFTDSQPRLEFRIEYDSEYKATVIFGNNRAGMIPSNGSDVLITYRVGGGNSGNIVTGVVELQRNFLVPGFEFRIPVSFTNYTRGLGGYSGDTIDDIKNNMGPWIRTQSRIVAGSDYETYANQYTTEYHGKIGKAKASLRNHGCAGNVIDLFVLALDEPNNLIEASNELKISMQNGLESYKMITDIVCIKDGVVVEVDISIDFTVDKFYRKFEEELRERAQRRIFNFFALNNWDYGKTLKAVDLIKELADIKEIRSVEVDFQTTDEDNSGEIITTSYYEIIRPSTYEMNFVYE